MVITLPMSRIYPSDPMKKCFKCGVEKERSEFYAHPEMKDGLLGKCKECCRADSRAHGTDKEYDRNRAMLPHRVAARKAHAQTEQGKQSHAKALRKSAAKYPEKREATVALNNALRDGRIIKKPCEMCGNVKSQGHHADYSKPLEVRWLCSTHHRQVHREMATEPF